MEGAGGIGNTSRGHGEADEHTRSAFSECEGVKVMHCGRYGTWCGTVMESPGNLGVDACISLHMGHLVSTGSCSIARRVRR